MGRHKPEAQNLLSQADIVPVSARRTTFPDDMRRALPPPVPPEWLIQAAADHCQDWAHPTRAENHLQRNARLPCVSRDCLLQRLSKRLPADRWPDHLRLSDIEPEFVFKACGKRGTEVRPLELARTGTGRTTRKALPLRFCNEKGRLSWRPCPHSPSSARNRALDGSSLYFFFIPESR